MGIIKSELYKGYWIGSLCLGWGVLDLGVKGSKFSLPDSKVSSNALWFRAD